MESTYFTTLIGQYVKVKYLDNGITCIIKGILQEANETFIVVEDVAVGLGPNFISCLPKGGGHG